MPGASSIELCSIALLVHFIKSLLSCLLSLRLRTTTIDKTTTQRVSQLGSCQDFQAFPSLSGQSLDLDSDQQGLFLQSVHEISH